MNKRLKVKNNISISTILSLVLISLGIGIVSWSLLNIKDQTQLLSNVYQSYYQGTATVVSIPEVPSVVVSIPENQAVVYEEYPSQGDIFGNLWIPVLKQNIPIVEGTGNEELKKGAGHFIDSVLPGVKDNCVISGHRETVFKNLGLLKIGDQLIIETSTGIFTYEINHIRIVDKDDRTVIVPTALATLTLTTCYPFNYIGAAPDRYILIGELVTSR